MIAHTESTWTDEARQRLVDYLSRPGYEIPDGLGTKEAACSVAAINLVLTGELSDDIPDCMSPVIGKWIIGVQDQMPTRMRNSAEWKALLPGAAGTGREYEKKRADILRDWMLDVVLPYAQPIADTFGYGSEWSEIRKNRTHLSCEHATKAIYRLGLSDPISDAMHNGANAAVWVLNYVYDSDIATEIASIAESIMSANEENLDDRSGMLTIRAATIATWEAFDPVGVLRRLIEVPNDIS